TSTLLVDNTALFSCFVGFGLLSFFFSSRRRHTRSKRDWSSDVCSSDLVSTDYLLGLSDNVSLDISHLTEKEIQLVYNLVQYFRKIGRASCRERVEMSVVGVILTRERGRKTVSICVIVRIKHANKIGRAS